VASDRVDRWLAAVVERHTAPMSRPEFLKAVRALSARYVERRAELPGRQPIDSAGKRAAFAGFYAPLHFLTTRAVVQAFHVDRVTVSRLIDLGCGTGVASAAWATACAAPPAIHGIDRHGWALREAAWNWRVLGLRGRGSRGDLVRTAEALARDRTRGESAIVLGWAVNELDDDGRRRLLIALQTLATRGVPTLVVEPIARGASPWWDDWAAATVALGGHVAEGRFTERLSPPLAAIDEAAGFRREGLAARALWFGPALSRS
jgi:hypothetical protein